MNEPTQQFPKPRKPKMTEKRLTRLKWKWFGIGAGTMAVMIALWVLVLR